MTTAGVQSVGISTNSGEESRYLIFRLGEELYGTPLLGVREVVEPHEPKPIPNTNSHFLGVINIRGAIVGVLDLRAKFGHRSSSGLGNAFMVFDTEAGPMAALVDKVEAVVKIADECIEKEPRVRTAVPAEDLIGIAEREEDGLITLVELRQTLGRFNVKG